MNKKIITIGLIIYATVTYSQTKQSTIDEITISGKILDTPYSQAVENIIIINKEQIKNSPANSIDELLQQFSGMDIRKRGANGVQSDITIRGGSFEQVLVLINGVRINDSQTGHNTMNIPINLNNVEKVEIIKGPAARKFGNNAFSGVINIITKTSEQKSVEISATAADYETYAMGLNATFGNKTIQNAIQINSQTSQGYRHNTDYDIKNAFYQTKIKLNNGRVNIQAGFIEKKFGANGFYSSPKATEQYEETQASIISTQYQAKWNKWDINSTLHWRRGQDIYTINRNKPEIYRNISIGNNIGINTNAAYSSAAGTTEIGIAVRKEYLNSNNTNTFSKTNISIGLKERLVTEVFAEHKISLIDKKLTIIPGISWANISNSGNFIYPGIDIGYKPIKNHKIYSNIAKVNRIPTFFDLYYISATELGNPNLKPENAISYEIGYQYLKNNTEIKASYFAKDTKNGIDWAKNDIQDRWIVNNVNKIKTQGVDIEVNKQIKNNKISVGYTYIDTKIAQNATFSRYLADHFKHQIIAKWNTQITKNIRNQITYRYQERITGYSYQILDNKISYHKNQLTIYTLINNLTNTSYTEAFEIPMPKRWFHIGFSYNIPLT